MSFSRSRIAPEVDFDREGKQQGFLRIPHSVHRSAYGWLPMPVVTVRNGEGPRVLLMSGNHGDEYEGQVTLSRLARTLSADAVRGQLIILTMSNYPAAKAGRRTSPIDGGNLNRHFPGNPDGSVTEMIAHMIEEELMSQVDLVVDLHSGGSSLLYLPSTQSMLDEEGRLDPRERALIDAWGAPYNHVLAGSTEDNHSSGGAHRQGALFITGEFAGSGTVTPNALRICEQGLARALHAYGVAGGAAGGRRDRPRRRATSRSRRESTTCTPRKTGSTNRWWSWETWCARAIRRAPFTFPRPRGASRWWSTSKSEGMVVCKRVPGRSERGDCLFHLASDWNG